MTTEQAKPIKTNRKKKGSASARNRMARLLAVQAVYQLMMTDLDIDAVLLNVKDRDAFRDEDVKEEFVDHTDTLFLSIVRKQEERKADLEVFLKEALGEAKYKGLDVLLKSVLLCGGTEILAHDDVDAPIVINDYMVVTEGFFEGDGEKKMVNAVLDKLFKQVR